MSMAHITHLTSVTCSILCFGQPVFINTCRFQMTMCIQHLHNLVSYWPDLSFAAFQRFLMNLFMPWYAQLYLYTPIWCVSFWKLLWDQEAKECGTLIEGTWIRPFFHILNGNNAAQHAEYYGNSSQHHYIFWNILPCTGTPIPPYITSST
jgi:hypothetical protein